MSKENNTEVVVEEVSTQEVVSQKVVAKKAPANEKESKEVKIKFLLSPTGRFNLAYNRGEVAKIYELQANELIEAGFAEIVK